MATAFREILGDELLTEPIDIDSEKLPSPNQLKRKFILKVSAATFFKHMCIKYDLNLLAC